MSRATLTHETRFDRQKLGVKLRFPGSCCNLFRTKWGSIAKNWGKIAISRCPAQPVRTKWSSIVKTLRFTGSRCNHFAWNEVRSPKTGVKLRVQVVPRNPFGKNEVRSSKTGKIAISGFPSQPFRTKWGLIAKNWGKIAISTSFVRRNPFARNEVQSPKNWGKIAISSVCNRVCVKTSVCCV